MKCAAWLILFAVTWDVFFTPFGGGAAFTSSRSRTFETRAEMKWFVKHAPRSPFECVESTTGQSGICEVKNMQGK